MQPAFKKLLKKFNIVKSSGKHRLHSTSEASLMVYITKCNFHAILVKVKSKVIREYDRGLAKLFPTSSRRAKNQ